MDSLVAVVSDGGDIDAAVANMLIVQFRWGHPSERSSFHSKYIGTFLVEVVNGNAVVLGDGLVLQLMRDRFHSVPSMVPHCRVGFAEAFCLNWRSYDVQSQSPGSVSGY